MAFHPSKKLFVMAGRLFQGQWPEYGLIEILSVDALLHKADFHQGVPPVVVEPVYWVIACSFERIHLPVRRYFKDYRLCCHS